MKRVLAGARVQIKPCLKYWGRFAGAHGEIVRVYKDCVAVRIDGIGNPRSKYGAYWFARKDIKIIEREEMRMYGNYFGAEVTFLNGTNTDRKYRYALYDTTIQPDDIVVVQTGNHGLAVARVVSIDDEPNGPAVSCGREIVCKVDMTAFENRRVRAAQLVEIKALMDSRVQKLQENAIYEMLAEKDPEMASMLQTYKDLLAQ